jgi:hypothetical protein
MLQSDSSLGRKGTGIFQMKIVSGYWYADIALTGRQQKEASVCEFGVRGHPFGHCASYALVESLCLTISD